MLNEGQVVLCLCQVENVINAKADGILPLSEIFSQLNHFLRQAFLAKLISFFHFHCC